MNDMDPTHFFGELHMAILGSRVRVLLGLITIVSATRIQAQESAQDIPSALILENAVRLAIDRNPILAAAKNEIQAAEGDRVAAGKRLNPAFSLQFEDLPHDVVEKMLDGGFNIGGEQSGHIIFLDFNTTGDGPITAAQVLSLMKISDAPLSKLASRIKLFPQVLMNVEVEKRLDIRSVPEIEGAVKKAEKMLGSRGRVLVRASGTEPKIRVMLEGEDEKLITKLGRDISKVIKEKMQ